MDQTKSIELQKKRVESAEERAAMASSERWLKSMENVFN